MKKFLVACLLALSSVAYAEPRLEMGIGYAQSQKMSEAK